MTRATCVCWSMTSETRIAYGSRVLRHGRSRPCSSNQARSAASIGPTLQRQFDRHVCASTRPRSHPDLAVVCADDRFDNGEPEAAAVAGRDGAAEGLESLLHEAGGEAGALVAHVQLGGRAVS